VRLPGRTIAASSLQQFVNRPHHREYADRVSIFRISGLLCTHRTRWCQKDCIPNLKRARQELSRAGGCIWIFYDFAGRKWISQRDVTEDVALA
jgi:hypothetical protein